VRERGTSFDCCADLSERLAWKRDQADVADPNTVQFSSHLCLAVVLYSFDVAI
jgi:hypothetical protein